jgi:integrase
VEFGNGTLRLNRGNTHIEGNKSLSSVRPRPAEEKNPQKHWSFGGDSTLLRGARNGMEKKVRLTKSRVEAIEPTERDRLVWDAEIPGFGVKITPKGARIYVLQYSRRNRSRRVTIGRHGVGGLTADQARKEAEILRGTLRAGGDPAGDRARDRSIPTMRALAERYMSEHAWPKKKRGSADGDRCLLDCHILPLLGDHRVCDISRPDLRHFLNDVASGKTRLDQKTGLRGRRIVRGGKGAANRCLAVLSKMFTLAEDWGYRAPGDNPARGVEKFDESAGRDRARFLSETMLARLGDALVAAETADPRHSVPANIIRLLLLTGARKSEIVGLRRERIDLERGLVRLPDSKTGPKVIILSAPARQLIAELLQHGPQEGYLFPGPRPARRGEIRPYGGLKGFWAIVSSAADLGDCRIHDLRHTHASIGVAGGASLLIVGKLLGHSQVSMTERYSHLADDPVRAVADSIGNRIHGALSGRNAAEILPMSRPTRAPA